MVKSKLYLTGRAGLKFCVGSAFETYLQLPTTHMCNLVLPASTLWLFTNDPVKLVRERDRQSGSKWWPRVIQWTSPKSQSLVQV